MKKFIVFSNIILLFPIVASIIMREWVYLAFSVALIFSSTSYHYYREKHPRMKQVWNLSRRFDWVFAVGAYCYMFYFVYTDTWQPLRTPFAVGLILSLLFFWYGFKLGNYKKLHPWFHVLAFTLAGLIVMTKI